MGLRKAIETPEEFLELFYEFRKWKLKQYIITPIVDRQGNVKSLPHIPPLTWAGFDAWLFEHKILQDTEDYRHNTDNRYEAFKGVIRVINQIMYANKFEGAAVGAFNHNIIARDLGLVEKKDVTVTEQPLFPDVSKNDSNK